jgi:DNA-binding beta-propeller fold protein YncE
MSSSPSFCGICDIRHISKPSEVWCPDCEEGLCTQCIEHHSLAKPSRNHTTIPIEEYQKLPSYVLEIKEHCDEHHEKFNLYCKEHECPCCRICNLENHSDCKNVSTLEKLITNVKTSTMFTDINHLMKEMIENIGKIRHNRETNSSAVKEQKEIIEIEIQELRTKINNHLDKLQDDLMKELTEAEKQVTEETRELLVSLDEKQKELTEYQTNIVSIKKYASDLQTFLAVRQIEKDVETKDMCLQYLVNSESLNQTKLSYKIDTGLKTITTSILQFGEVVVESKPCEFTFLRKKDKQAQMMVADLSPPMSVENIQLTLNIKIKTKGSLITGCSFLPDGKMVFSCSIPSSVRFINEDGVELFQIGKDNTGAGTYDAVYIKDDNSVAVSSGGSTAKRCITIIDIESKEVMTTISMETNIYGMAVRGRTIYYCTRNKGLQMLNLSDKSVSHIINSKMPRVYYVATFGDKLYYTDCHTDTVTCCDLHGTTQWQFKDDRTLHSLVGISVDNDGNVYVIGFTSDNVVVISPDGQRHRELLSAKDGLNNPSVLDYDKSKNRLIVVNKSRTAFLFDVTKRE